MGGTDGLVRSTLTVGERRRPAPDERLFLTWPGLFRWASRTTFRLSPRSRLRRALLVRNVQLSYEGQNRDDWRLTLLLYDDDSELLNVPIRGGGSRVAGVGFSYRGVDGARRLAEDWVEPWEQVRFLPSEILDAGDGRLLVLSHMVARGRGSGVEVTERLAQLIEFSGGRVRRQRNWLGSWDDGLEAVANEEPHRI